MTATQLTVPRPSVRFRPVSSMSLPKPEPARSSASRSSMPCRRQYRRRSDPPHGQSGRAGGRPRRGDSRDPFLACPVPDEGKRYLPAPGCMHDRQPGATGSPGDRRHPRRHTIRARPIRPGPRLQRRRREGSVHRRRDRHRQSGFHPGQRSTRLHRLPGLQRDRNRIAPGRRRGLPHASSIAAQGRETYNVANYAVGLDRPCKIRILGVAPGASLVGLNVFGAAPVALNSVFLEAINMRSMSTM